MAYNEHQRAVILAVNICAIAAMGFLCSCSSMVPWEKDATPAAERPADVLFDQSTGRGMMLSTRIRLENGTELWCAVDTGSPTSLLPASLEPILGKRLGSSTVSTIDGTQERIHYYAAPRLYLGGALLETGPVIGTRGGPQAILGKDCLRHYCIQLDFVAGKMRFLDAKHLDATDLGKAFRFVNSPYTIVRHAAFFQTKDSELLIDTGCFADGYLEPGLFKRAVREEKRSATPINGGSKGKTSSFTEVPKCVWDGNIYTDLMVGKGAPNLVGMRFLARHLVTFNFPGRAMYLKQNSTGPLAAEGSEPDSRR